MSIVLAADPSHTFKCGDKHSFAKEGAPELYRQRSYFSSTDTESHILLGRGSRMLDFECWIQDSSFTTRALIDAYLLEIDQLLGNQETSSGTLTIEIDSVTQTYENCYFVGFQRAEPGVPIPNAYLGAADGPQGNFWIEGVLKFVQAKV